MPRQKSTDPSHDTQARSAARRNLRILVVDPEPETHQLVAKAIDGSSDVLKAVGTDDALRLIEQKSIDLVLIDPTIEDGRGIELARRIREEHPLTQTIVMSGEPSMERAVEALRAGAADFMIKPVDLGDLNDRVKAALAHQSRDLQRVKRIRRLRRICKKLNTAHEEVSQQVDILCSDLVTAYQELATQIQQVMHTGEFQSILKQELDLERLLRKTLEHLLEKGGPMNAAVFLPSNIDEYALGGYVNLDCSKEAADLLLDHLADVLAPKVANCIESVHITDNDVMHRWIGDDAAYLEDAHLLAFACRHKHETLAVIAMFRDNTDPFSDELVNLCGAIAPMLGDHLAKVIRIHHRHVADMSEPE